MFAPPPLFVGLQLAGAVRTSGGGGQNLLLHDDDDGDDDDDDHSPTTVTVLFNIITTMGRNDNAHTAHSPRHGPGENP
jgi:hypothetical protein